MRIRVLGGFGGESLDCRMTCLLINDRVALDAGSLTQGLAIEEQVRVHSILLTHSHMDHTSSLPFFIENVYGKSEGAIRIHSSPATVYAIRKYLFNNATWPDFTRLPNHLLPAVRGDLLEKLGRVGEARAEFERAASLTRNARERALLLERASSMAGKAASR